MDNKDILLFRLSLLEETIKRWMLHSWGDREMPSPSLTAQCIFHGLDPDGKPVNMNKKDK